MLFNYIKLQIALLLLAGITACGGSSDSKAPSPTTPPTEVVLPTEIIKNATQYSISELNTAASALVEERYKGSSAPANVNLQTAQHIFKQLFSFETIEIPYLALYFINDNLDDGSLDASVDCPAGGTLTMKGDLDEAALGHIELQYNACVTKADRPELSGNIALVLKHRKDLSVGQTVNENYYYFDNFSWSDARGVTKLTGIHHYRSEVDAETRFIYTNVENKYLLSFGDKEQLLLDIATESGYVESQNIGFNMVGSYSTSESGKIAINAERLMGPIPGYSSGSIELEGDKKTALEFSNPGYGVRYIEDIDADQIFDIGAYLINIKDLLEGDLSTRVLAKIDEMSLPPKSGRPSFYHGDAITTAPIYVAAGSYSDPDTPNEQLTISYRWYINGELIVDQYTNMLPANIAHYQDLLQVTMVIEDQYNLVESTPLTIALQDAPAQAKVAEVHDPLIAGNQVKFTVEGFDPDMIIDDIHIGLLSGPAGATIDQHGVVTWNIEKDFLFPYQTFEFIIGLTDINGNELGRTNLALEVSSNKSFPIARSGIEVPKYESSMWLGDHNGDGQKELLLTDNIEKVFLLEYLDSAYKFLWQYPFSLPTSGNISQVLSYNIDDDTADEILIVTENGISIIDGLNSKAYSLLSTLDVITRAAITDIDSDGIPEVAYLHHAAMGSREQKISLFSLNHPQISLFSIDAPDVSQFVFGNVDTDENIELVTNTGIVFDTQLQQVQWTNGAVFGNALLTAGDFTGNGTQEIIGADTWDNISMYSAHSQSKIALLDNFNTCSILSVNIDADDADELLVGGCQSGGLKAYDFLEGEFKQKWSINAQGHSVSSLLVADSDKDGNLEVHWGTGIGSTGEDKLVIAELTELDAQLKADHNSVQLDSFSSAGWSAITEDNEHAVFFVPSSQSGYEGSRLVIMDKEGDYKLSEPISYSNTNSSLYATTTDFNHDGFGDIFLPSMTTHDGTFAAIQLFDSALHWEDDPDYLSDIGVIKAVDFNRDGFDDAALADRNIFKVFDVDQEKLIASYTFDEQVVDFAFDEQASMVTVVSHGDRVSVITQVGTSFNEHSNITKNCSRLEMFNFDRDDALEVLCIDSDRTSFNRGGEDQLVVFELVGYKLVEQARYSFEAKILDMAIDPSSTVEQNIFLVTQLGNLFPKWNAGNFYSIEQLKSNGDRIWQGPGLVGQPSAHGLKVRYTAESGYQVMLSTQKSMYLIQ